MSRPREFVEPWRPEDIEERYRELEHMSHGEDEQNSSGECRDICPTCLAIAAATIIIGIRSIEALHPTARLN